MRHSFFVLRFLQTDTDGAHYLRYYLENEFGMLGVEHGSLIILIGKIRRVVLVLQKDRGRFPC